MTRSRPPQSSAPRARWLATLVFLSFSSFGNPSYAQGQPELSAREHFERGVEANRQGDLVLALDHFEKAQALTPSQTVLYNLGQTYFALGRPVEALRVLERYLEADGASGDAARRREVDELVRRSQARVGTLDVTLEPSDASLDIDGVPANTAGAGPLRVAVGRHLLTATKAGYRPSLVRVDVAAGEPVRARLELEPVSLHRDGFIEPSCATPEAVRRAMENDLRAKLDASAERERARRQTTRQIVAYTSGGVGIALGTVAAILYATNQSRYEEWNRDQRALSNELAEGETSPDHAGRAANLNDRAANIQRTDDVALGAGIFGGVLVAVSVGLLLTGEKPSTASRQNAVSHPLRFTW
jgi:tetratricopeptide (TPR) repeat protein